MRVLETKLPGVVIIEPRVFEDSRGYFLETWNEGRYTEAGLPGPFVQDNLSFSRRGVLRGLHYQNPDGQGKLVYVPYGEVFDVAVDIRIGSPTFGQWLGVQLSAENRRQLYIPEGFAHGFLVTSDNAWFAYKCTRLYDPSAEGGVLWNDPDIGIDWPDAEPILSGRDRAFPRLSDIIRTRLPVYGGS